jgi:histidyl-tRNA synthetase
MKITTESYKGVRDFYPEDQFIQNFIFKKWRKVVEGFGYQEYNASILEPAELYLAKSGEEIVNEQTYTFRDRGERDVTMRPEMTPTVARMVAARQKELFFPLRWYSIPNLFRYEKPQKGRLREHWQLNVDLFGVSSIEADLEIVKIAYSIMREFGAQDSDFMIKVNSRKIINDLYKKFDLNPDQSYKVSKIIDKKEKISKDVFLNYMIEIIGDGDKAMHFAELLESNEKLLQFLGETKETKELIEFIEKITEAGVTNIMFDSTLMRGFDYYTGIVFEVFDTNPENPRSVFGGGRYDDLLDIFGSAKVPAFGFGAGDVTARDFLESHKLLPTYRPSTDLYICVLDKALIIEAEKIGDTLRKSGLNVAIDLSFKKVGDQMKLAHRQMIPFVLTLGENEIKSGIYPVKNMETGEEKKVKLEEIKEIIKFVKL